MKFRVLVLIACTLCAIGSESSVRAGLSVIPTHGRNIYRLVVARLDGRAEPTQLVGASYEGRVCAFAADGRSLWDATTGGFVFDLAAGDLDGSGRDSIVAACADGFVYAFAGDGTLVWKKQLGAPVYQVAVAKLTGKAPVVLACGVTRELVALSPQGERLAATKLNGAGRMMRAGDFDGDGADEVAVLPVRGQAQDISFFKGPKLTKLKEVLSSGVIPWDPVMRRSKDTGANYRKGKKDWNGQSLKKANGTVADLDGDGMADLLYSPGVYTLKGGLRPLLTLPDTFATASYDTFYNMRLIAAGDLTDRPGVEIVVVEGPEVRLLDSTGKQLGRAVAPQGFTDVVYLPGSPHGSVILGSSPNGDDNLYRLSFEPGWEKAVETIARHGCMAQVGANLQSVSDAAVAWHGAPMRGADGPFDLVVSHHMWSGWDPGKIAGWIAEVSEYKKQFPYPHLRFATAFWPGEKAPLLRPDGQPWGRDRRLAHDLTREQIVDAARRFEAAHCHFWVQVGHGCAPHLEVATIAAMLEAAPTSLLGFISAEDEQLDEMAYYVEHHIKPILELCLKHHKRVILRNKDVWWAHWPADAKLRALIFNGRYRSVLVPSVEDSNSRNSEVNLAARVGLWLDGQVDDWASRCCADWFCASRAWEWEYGMTGGPQLRYYVSQAMLGARVFMMLNGEREQHGGRWTRVGTEGTATFLHLLGKGVLTPPRREQLRAISPVVIVLEHPSKRFQEHGANGHHEEKWGEDGTDNQPWAFDRLDAYWAMAPLPPTDVATYLWGRTRRDASHVPTTAPCGFVCLLPGAKPQTSGCWTSLWTTDGDTLKKDGKTYSLTDARMALTAELTGSAQKFPFRVEGQAFHQIIEQDAKHYVLVLVDAGWLNPVERDVKLAAQRRGDWLVTDRLTGAKLGNLSQPLALRVPAGAFRLLDLSSTGN